MNVRELTTYFRELADEPDENFLTSTQVENYLAIAYDEFRSEICNIDQLAFVEAVTIMLTGGSTYDLATGAVVILGSAAPAGDRMLRLISIALPVTGAIGQPTLRPVSSLRALNHTPNSYMLQGTTLYFSEAHSASYTLSYLPVSAVDWSKTAVLDDEFIDDYTSHHDVIALLALLQYYIRDGIVNAPAVSRLDQRIQALREHVGNRVFSASQYVQTATNW